MSFWRLKSLDVAASSLWSSSGTRRVLLSVSLSLRIFDFLHHPLDLQSHWYTMIRLSTSSGLRVKQLLMWILGRLHEKHWAVIGVTPRNQEGCYCSYNHRWDFDLFCEILGIKSHLQCWYSNSKLGLGKSFHATGVMLSGRENIRVSNLTWSHLWTA